MLSIDARLPDHVGADQGLLRRMIDALAEIDLIASSNAGAANVAVALDPESVVRRVRELRLELEVESRHRAMASEALRNYLRSRAG